MILPYPQKDSLYLVLYQASGFLPNGIYGVKEFLYATVDMSKNNGKGEVIEKSISLLNYYVAYGKLSAVKHANGIDWWILTMELEKNIFHRYLLSKNGLKYLDQQIIDPADPDGVGCAVFSPDGRKYVRYNDVVPNLPQLLDIYDFDRCSGLLSNHKRISYINKGGSGVVFSPNSRFLYVGLGTELRQYDMQATNLKDSEKTVAIQDTNTSCLEVPEGFYNGQLAPDGKIYFSTDGCSKVLHIIHKPDLEGLNCQVELRGVKLPTFIFRGLPNFPNYKLGKMAGCSSSTQESKETAVNIYPNPVKNDLTLTFNASYYQKGVFHLTDLQGRRIASYPIQPDHDEYHFDISAIPNGMYLWQLVLDDNIRQTGKVAVMKE
jgi:Secretion system C-terminal sorting domain